VERDGSCTRERAVINGMGVEAEPDLQRYLNYKQTGGELVSPVFSLTSNTRKMVNDVERIIDLLDKSGEYISDLTSFHVHVYLGQLPPVRKFKSLLEICRRIEAPMFKLSVAELREHRGVTHNDYQYCRPIMGVGPQFVVDDFDEWRQCFDLDALLGNAKSSLEIMQGWGRADRQPRKWVPARYYWVNPCPLVRQGTIEFRPFNQTMDARNILAWVWLCAAIVRTALEQIVDLEQPLFPLGLTSPVGNTGGYSLDHLFEVIYPGFIPEDQIIALDRLWSKSPWQKPIQGEQVNHLSKRGDRIPLENIRGDLLAPRVPKEYIDEIWEDGYH
jgi:hypothetical protein